MNYIIMDLEWNQSEESQKEVKQLPFEIIEIGAVKLNQEKQVIGEFSQLIKPVIYKKIHHVTKKLIHLQMSELENGMPFQQVAASFLSWCGEDVVFCTWGPLDLTELQRNMVYYGMPALSDKPLAFLDIQKLFSIAYEDGKFRRSLEFAVDFLQIEKDIPFHRAFSDAYYTAKVLAGFPDRSIEQKVSFDMFIAPKSRKDEIHIIFDNYAKYISREFEDKAEALSDKEVISTKCHLCRRNIKKKMKWFSTNGKHYYSVGFCEKHGYIKYKIRIRKSENDKIYVVKTMKYISEEENSKICEMQRKTKELKKQRRSHKTTFS